MNHEAADYAGKRIVVTGAAGFTGGNLVRCLVDQGAKVHGWLHSETSPAALPVPGVNYQAVDITDQAAVHAAMASAKPQIIFHLAAPPRGDTTAESLRRHAEVTLLGTINVAAAAASCHDCLLIHLGSCEEYGDGEVPFKEGQPERPLSAYSAAKAAATQFLMVGYRALQLPVIVLRPAVVYGPGQLSSMLVPYLFSCYRSAEPARMTAGEQSRDFVFIEDLTAALLLAGLRPDLSGQIFNIASQQEHKIKDVAATIAQICGYTGNLGLGSLPYRVPEVMNQVASAARAQRLLGWQARVELAEGLERTYRWLNSGRLRRVDA